MHTGDSHKYSFSVRITGRVQLAKMPNSVRLLQIYVATEAMPECEMCGKEFLPKSRQLSMLRIQMFLFSVIKIAKVCTVALLLWVLRDGTM